MRWPLTPHGIIPGALTREPVMDDAPRTFAGFLWQHLVKDTLPTRGGEDKKGVSSGGSSRIILATDYPLSRAIYVLLYVKATKYVRQDVIFVKKKKVPMPKIKILHTKAGTRGRQTWQLPREFLIYLNPSLLDHWSKGVPHKCLK